MKSRLQHRQCERLSYCTNESLHAEAANEKKETRERTTCDSMQGARGGRRIKYIDWQKARSGQPAATRQIKSEGSPDPSSRAYRL